MKKMLIIDDHHMFRTMLIEFLKQNNEYFDFYEAIKGKEGIRTSQKIHPDIAIVDFLLPGTNGITVSEEIKKSDPKCKVVLVSYDESIKHFQKTSEKYSFIDVFVSKSELDKQIISILHRFKNGKSKERANERKKPN